MKKLLLFIFASISFSAFAQKESFDILSFTPVANWQMERSDNTVSLTGVDEANGTFCIITLYKSLDGSADSKKNFRTAWKKVVQDNFGTGKPKMEDPSNENGWELQTGAAAFDKSGTKGVVTLVTATANSKMINLVILTNSDTYLTQISDFMSSIELPNAADPATSTPAGSADR